MACSTKNSLDDNHSVLLTQIIAATVLAPYFYRKELGEMMNFLNDSNLKNKILKIARILFTISPLLVLTMYTWNDLDGSAKTLPPAQFKHRLEKQHGVLMDVRTPEEYKMECIAGAINLDVQEEGFKNRLVNLDKNVTYFLYCLAGKRSAMAMGIMENAGFKKVYDLKGGITEWKKKGFPVTKPKL